MNKNIAICALALALTLAVLWKTPQYPHPGDVLAPPVSSKSDAPKATAEVALAKSTTETEIPKSHFVPMSAAFAPAPPPGFAAAIGPLNLSTIDVQLLALSIAREKYAVARQVWWETHDATTKHLTVEKAGGRGPAPCAGCLAAEAGDFMGDTQATAVVAQRVGVDLRQPIVDFGHVRRGPEKGARK